MWPIFQPSFIFGSISEKKKIKFGPLLSGKHKIAKASNVISSQRSIVSWRYEGLHQGMDYKFLFISKKPKGGRGWDHNGEP